MDKHETNTIPALVKEQIAEELDRVDWQCLALVNWEWQRVVKEAFFTRLVVRERHDLRYTWFSRDRDWRKRASIQLLPTDGCIF